MDEIRGQSFNPTTAARPGQLEQLRRAGLYAEIKTLDDYNELVFKGMTRVETQIKKRPQATISVDQLKEIHRIIFNQVHPWAGEVREPGQRIFFGQNEGSQPERLSRELALWEAQSKELLEAAKTPQDKVAAIAFSHARFERIHPFRDGNGRTGRAIMNHQLTAALGKKVRSRLDRREYIDALKAASHGNLTDLVKVLGKREGIAIPESVQFLSSYRLAPLTPDKKEYSLREELQASKMSQFAMNIMLKAEVSAKTKAPQKNQGLDLSR